MRHTLVAIIALTACRSGADPADSGLPPASCEAPDHDLPATVLSPIDLARIVDDGPYITGVGNTVNKRFAVVGEGWTARDSARAYGRDERVLTSSEPGDYAIWAFPNLNAWTYQLAVTWVAGASSAVTYAVYDADGGLLDSFEVDQGESPADVEINGTSWTVLGELTLDVPELYVVATTTVGGRLVADGVRLDAVGQTYEPPSGLPVFPGATGFGRAARAGRCGEVIRVTNLDDEGPGSLRWAIEQEGPRTVVFEVGGVIDTTEVLVIDEPYLTVAGQTAPSPGITVRGAGLVVQASEVLVQHVRFRVGDRADGPDPGTRDGVRVQVPEEDPERPVHNVVIDHCSFAWAVDETLDVWGWEGFGVGNVSLTNNIASEALYLSIHPDDHGHSMGGYFAENARNVSVQRNLFAHTNDRNPRIQADSVVEFDGNTVYNGHPRAILDGGYLASRYLASLRDNTYLAGPVDKGDRFYVLFQTSPPDSEVYHQGNVGPGGDESDWSDAYVWSSQYEAGVVPVDDRQYIERFRVDEPSADSGSTVAAFDLDDVGARPWDRDAIDERVVSEVRAGTGSVIDSPSQREGLDYAVEATFQELELPERPHEDDDHDGYTNLEEWIHAF